ncbi:MAG TPA: hypothetical protein VFC58_00975 [Desulfosporosinus sp.]|nr:hypothetical protein [Desulfosporosinus sp.]
MKKYDIIWLLGIITVFLFLILPSTHSVFMAATATHPFLMGFVKFAFLATMGELLALRLVQGDWKRLKGLLYKGAIWGILGMAIVLVFDIYAGGVAGSIKKGLLPSIGGNLGFAFFTSALMNLFFAPTFMAFHRITDTYIDLGEGKLNRILKVKLSEVVNHIDWDGYVRFVVLKTIPFFWIPAHTVVFLLPVEYRVLAAAFLSIALGGILAFAKKHKIN